MYINFFFLNIKKIQSETLIKKILHIVKDVVKHHFIHLSHHPSVHPSVSSWSVYSNGAEKEWNTDAARQRIIYISVVNFHFYFYFFWGFWT